MCVGPYVPAKLFVVNVSVNTSVVDYRQDDNVNSGPNFKKFFIIPLCWIVSKLILSHSNLWAELLCLKH